MSIFLRENFTRRAFLTVIRNLLISIFVWGFVGSCKFSKKDRNNLPKSIPHLTHLLGYLLYEENPPASELKAIENQLRITIQNSSRAREELALLSTLINEGEDNISFETLSSEDKKTYFKSIKLIVANSSVISEIIQQYLQGGGIQKYLDYPDVPSKYGECGWLINEGVIWDRYYPPSGS